MELSVCTSPNSSSIVVYTGLSPETRSILCGHETGAEQDDGVGEAKKKGRGDSVENLRGRIYGLSRSIGQQRVLFGVRTGSGIRFEIYKSRTCVYAAPFLLSRDLCQPLFSFSPFHPHPGHCNLSPPSCVTFLRFFVLPVVPVFVYSCVFLSFAAITVLFFPF